MPETMDDIRSLLPKNSPFYADDTLKTGSYDTKRDRHNHARLMDLKILRNEYKNRGILRLYAINLAFWHFAYAVLWYKDIKSAKWATEDFVAPMKVKIDLENSVYVPVLEKYMAFTPYLLTNKGFIEKFNIPEDILLRLVTVSEPVPVLDRVNKHRKKKEKLNITLFYRRCKAEALRKSGKTIEQIAKKLKVSVATVFGDLKKAKEQAEKRDLFRSFRKWIISTLNKAPLNVVCHREEIDVLDIVRGIIPIARLETG